MSHEIDFPFESIYKAVEKIEDEFPDADVEMGMEVGVIEYLVEAKIEVTDDINNVDEWSEKQDKIREIARECEDGDEIIYTRLDRKH